MKTCKHTKVKHRDVSNVTAKTATLETCKECGAARAVGKDGSTTPWLNNEGNLVG